MRVDPRQRMEFPLEEAVTNKRPMWSATTKQAILLEMTVPWEDRRAQKHAILEDCYSLSTEWMKALVEVDVAGLLVNPCGEL